MRRVRDDLRSRGLPVWTDETLEPGTPIWEFEIANAIENAACMLVLLTPESKKSIWVSREIGYAEGQDIHIFPFLLRGDDRSAVPFRLISSQWIDARRDYETSFDMLTGALSQYMEQRRAAQKDALGELPTEIRALIEDASPFKRVVAVAELHGLLSQAKPQLMASIQTALQRLMQDTKTWVAAAASECFTYAFSSETLETPIENFEIERLLNQSVDEATFDAIVSDSIDPNHVSTADNELITLSQAVGANLVNTEFFELASKAEGQLALEEMLRQQVDETAFDAIFSDVYLEEEYPYLPQEALMDLKEAADMGILDF